MSMPRVVHCKREPYDVYIGRNCFGIKGQEASFDWGNPFKLDHSDDAEVRAAAYEQWLLSQVQHAHIRSLETDLALRD